MANSSGNHLATSYCKPCQHKHKLYDSGSGPGQQLHYQSSPGDLAVVEGQRNGKFRSKVAHVSE